MASGAIAWRLTWPLLAVIDAARKIGDGDLSTRIKTRHQHGELHILAEAINDMASRIERQIADQRELLAAVSQDRKSTRLNSSHPVISYAGFCFRKKKTQHR